LLIAHGLFGSARNWGSIAKTLASGRPVLTVDMRNHGESFWADTHSYPELANDLAEVVDAYGGRADIVGHSMGGKAAMALALSHADRVGRLIVADIAPVTYRHSQMPYLQAMRTVDLSRVDSRKDADRQLAEYVPELAIRAFLLQSLDVNGGRWRLNLDTLEREMDTVTAFPDIGGAFEGSTLFVSGGESDYVRPEHRETIKARFPKARMVKIPGAHHWLHAEKPREFEATVAAFLDRTE
jgi:pimeloyl-ACP methyl ester carboxylesterase